MRLYKVNIIMKTSTAIFGHLSFLVLACLVLLFTNCKEDPFVPHESLIVDENQIEEEIMDLTTDFYARTGIQIYYKATEDSLQTALQNLSDWNDGMYMYEHSEIADVLEEIEILIGYLDEFPNGFLLDIQLEHIFLFSSNDLNWNGLAIKLNNLIALNKGGVTKETTIAHELFHFFDPGIPVINESSDLFIEWGMLNPPDFEYGDGCEFNASIDTYSEAFLSAYSRCNQHEDRAVLFSYLYSDIGLISSLLDQDEYLQSKAEYIRGMVSEYDFTF